MNKVDVFSKSAYSSITPYSGHLGIARTHDSISKNYHQSCLHQDIDHCLQHCSLPTCTEASCQKLSGLLQLCQFQTLNGCWSGSISSLNFLLTIKVMVVLPSSVTGRCIHSAYQLCRAACSTLTGLWTVLCWGSWGLDLQTSGSICSKVVPQMPRPLILPIE